MKIVYMGTPAFACPPLETLAKSNHQVLAVVTGRDKPAGRGKKITPTETAVVAERLKLPVIKPASLGKPAFITQIKDLSPDLIVVIAFRILPPQIYTLPRLGSINIHGSLLPKYRGAAPINWALINGERETGLSAFYLKQQVDTGDLIYQEETTIHDNDNFDSLYQKLSEMAGPFLLKVLGLIELGEVVPQIQDDRLATPAPKLTPYDAFIDFGFPAAKVANFVRGLSSRPGAFTYHRGKKLKVLAARAWDGSEKESARPGTVIETHKRLLIQCAADSVIEFTRLVPEGKKEMDGLSFINGFRPQPGEILGEIPQRSKLLL